MTFDEYTVQIGCTMEIGAIKSVHIYCHNKYYVTAALNLNVKGVNFCFGGHLVFLSGMYGENAGDLPYLGKFIFRCLQICDQQDWELIKSQKVLVDIVDNVAVGIGTLSGNDFFYPDIEFENGSRTSQCQTVKLEAASFNQVSSGTPDKK